MKRTGSRTPFASLMLCAAVVLDITTTAGSEVQAQELEWATRLGMTRRDVGSDIHTTPAGESYVTGRIDGPPLFSSAGDADVFVAKYDRSGALLWEARAGGTGFDQGSGIATTPRGESYVTGRFTGTAVFGLGEPNETELVASPPAANGTFVAKYDRNGALLWVTNAGGGPGLDIATTPRGESYVTGFGFRFVAKYSRDGVLLWATQGSGLPLAIATTPRGESYVTGRFTGTAVFGLGEPNETELVASPPGTNYDIFVAKYDRDGSLLWATRAGGANTSEGLGIATTPRGESYVTGYFTGTAIFGPGEPNQTELTAESSDVFVAKYSRDGVLLWATRAAGGPGSEDATAIATTPRGESYVTGYFTGTAIFGPGEPNQTELTATPGSEVEGIPTDIFVAKYDRDGSLLWATRAGDTGRDVGLGVGTTARGGAYVTGYFEGTVVFGSGEFDEIDLTAAGDADIFVAKFR